jgi:hypothetical protein
MSRPIQSADFDSYPLQARQFAQAHLEILNSLPFPLAAAVVRQIARYDWLFPAERQELAGQLELLAGTPAPPAIASFAHVTLSPNASRLADTPWARDPGAISEALTSDLWATGQIDNYRAAAASLPRAEHGFVASAPRLVMVAISPECTLASPDQVLFERLRPNGCVFTNVHSAATLDPLLQAVHARATAHPSSYGHWYVDGDASLAPAPAFDRVEAGTAPVVLDYASLHDARRNVLSLMMAVIEGKPIHYAGMPDFLRNYEETQPGPEALRTRLFHLTPEDLGLATPNPSPAADLLAHFQVEVLGEGSGTQIYSTVFIQWIAREILRRAQPTTLVLRFTPRSTQVPLDQADQLLVGGKTPSFDQQGSLVDADIGTFYTWLNLQRLPGAEQSSFLAWHQGSSTAFVAGPAVTRGVVSTTQISMEDLLTMLNGAAKT